MKAKVAHTINGTKGALFSNIAVLKAVAVGVVSVVLGAGQLLGVISPFLLAFLCGVPSKYLVTSVLGSVVGCIIFVDPAQRMYYIILAVIIFAIRLAISRFIEGRPKPIFLGGVGFVASLVISLAYAALMGLHADEFFLLIIESVLVGAFAYFYAIATSAILLRKKGISFSTMELTSLALLFVPIITSLTGMAVFRISVGVIVGTLCIYIAIARFGIVGASISSIIVAIALNIYSLDMLEFSGMLIISSFIAGVFAPTKKFGIMASFVAVATFSLFMLGAPITLAFRVIEILFATALFVLVPSKFLNTAQSDVIIKSGVAPMRGTVSAKLNFASSTIKDLQLDLTSVSNRFNEIDSNNISTVYDSAANRICKGCTMQLKCWDDNCNETIRSFYPLNSSLRQYSKIDKTQMPTYFQDNCCKLTQLTNEINNSYHAYAIKEGTRRHVTESRGLIIDQFNSMAEMLIEVSEEISEINGYDQDVTNAVEKAFTKLYCEPTEVIASTDKFNRTSIEIYVDKLLNINREDLFRAVSNSIDLELEYPSVSFVGNKTKVAFFEKATYSIEFWAEQKSCDNNEICGDCYEYFIDGKGYAYCILSDGMGSGKRAAIDSVMTCSILLKLIQAGFGMTSALKLINSSLQVKSTDESLATIDVAKIDLYTGEVELFKAGAASSYVCKNGNAIRVDTTSLPVGIIQDIEFDKTNVLLSVKDILLMVSDGMIGAGDEWLGKILCDCCHMSAKEIARKIIFTAAEKVEGFKQDDQTILVCKLRKGV